MQDIDNFGRKVAIFVVGRYGVQIMGLFCV